jgi:hypothetical protein
VRDDADLILPYLARADTIVVVTWITFGCYSFQMKRIVDKFSLLIDSHYRYKHKELIKGDGQASIRFYAIGVHDRAEAGEIQAFEQLVSELLHISGWSGKPFIIQQNTPSLENIIEVIAT